MNAMNERDERAGEMDDTARWGGDRRREGTTKDTNDTKKCREIAADERG
jgi:hypothetical protein